jgi:hypothetical protein
MAVGWDDVISRGDLWLVVLAVLLPVAVFRLTPVTEYGRGFDSDGAYYAAMAGAPGVPPELGSRAPYCHRVLTPAVVARMSGDVLGRFRRLALWSSILNLVLVGVLVRRCGEGPLAAALAVLLYAGVFWTVKFPAYSPAYVDFQTQTFLLLVALLAPIVRARWWLIPVFVLGVLQKESLLAFAPFAIFASFRKRRASAGALAWAALLVVLPLGALLAVRLAVSQTNAYQPTDVFDYLGRLAQPGYGIRLIHAGISGLGLLPFVILLQPGAA